MEAGGENKEKETKCPRTPHAITWVLNKDTGRDKVFTPLRGSGALASLRLQDFQEPSRTVVLEPQSHMASGS